jgi:hypothetical protein
MAQGSVAGRPAWRRIMLKLSGEALLGREQYGIDPGLIQRVAGEIAEVANLGVQVGLVIGGGNVFRGAGLAEAGYGRPLGSVHSADSYVPLGPAAATVLLSEDDIVDGLLRLAPRSRFAPRRGPGSGRR